MVSSCSRTLANSAQKCDYLSDQGYNDTEVSHSLRTTRSAAARLLRRVGAAAAKSGSAKARKDTENIVFGGAGMKRPAQKNGAEDGSVEGQWNQPEGRNQAARRKELFCRALAIRCILNGGTTHRRRNGRGRRIRTVGSLLTAPTVFVCMCKAQSNGSAATEPGKRVQSASLW